MDKKNLWGEISEPKTRRNPYSILKEQANILGEITNGLLVGEVKHFPASFTEDANSVNRVLRSQAYHVPVEDQNQENFNAVLKIVAPPLNHYRYSVLQVRYPVHFYPLTLIDLANDAVAYSCADEKSFEQALERVLSSQKVRDVIEVLLSQIQEV